MGRAETSIKISKKTRDQVRQLKTRAGEDRDGPNPTSEFKHKHYSRTQMLAACGIQKGDSHE